MPPATAPTSVHGDQRAGLRRGQVQVRRDGAQHEAEDEQVEAVHRIADGGGEQGLPRGGVGRVGGRGCGVTAVMASSPAFIVGHSQDPGRLRFKPPVEPV